MHVIRTPNIVLMMQRVINGMDNRPFKAEFLGKKGIGPVRKNLLMPKEEVNTLKRNVKRGRAELKSSKAEMVFPISFFGKNPSVVNRIASEILT